MWDEKAADRRPLMKDSCDSEDMKDWIMMIDKWEEEQRETCLRFYVVFPWEMYPWRNVPFSRVLFLTYVLSMQ